MKQIILLAILLFILFLISLFSIPNFSFGICSFFILFSAFDESEKSQYESLFYLTMNKLEKNKPLNLKFYCVSSDSDVSSIYKLLNPNYYLAVLIMKDNKIKKIIMQDDLFKLLNKGELNGKDF